MNGKLSHGCPEGLIPSRLGRGGGGSSMWLTGRVFTLHALRGPMFNPWCLQHWIKYTFLGSMCISVHISLNILEPQLHYCIELICVSFISKNEKKRRMRNILQRYNSAVALFSNAFILNIWNIFIFNIGTKMWFLIK